VLKFAARFVKVCSKRRSSSSIRTNAGPGIAAGADDVGVFAYY
jgi:hypothetical protein